MPIINAFGPVVYEDILFFLKLSHIICMLLSNINAFSIDFHENKILKPFSIHAADFLIWETELFPVTVLFLVCRI